ncbi:M23 family metallopeptidase [Paenibacillus segetis]|uniref:Peptidase M23 n=1 Tax=Paenibacillus segetis TaxID=1325360 RepID=A0ABQ1Y4W1_9BACL|nr:M23 family metallopeptidase [Paenibacillus segetis]GGH12781.1 peptidase M23 [Paenibacillus segetis]
MKFRFKPTNKRYTIMIVPEGTNPVFRFKLRLATLLVSSFAVIFLIIMIMVLFTINRGNSNAINTLEAELSNSSNRLQTTVDDKDETIDKLLTELLVLSEKSKSIEAKMTELEKLETDLKSITGDNTEATQSKSKSPLSSEPSQDSLEQSEGMGGESIPLSDEDILDLIQDTKESITHSLQQIPDLQSRLEETKITIEDYKEMMMILPTKWPTVSTRITSDFGSRKDPFTRKLRLHSGLDIGGQLGDPIYAAANGKVIDIGYSSARGNYVTISHPSGLQTNYLHMKKVTTTIGAEVKQGDTIGELGSTGRSTGPHLHIEVVKNGNTIDPEIYLTMPREEDGL